MIPFKSAVAAGLLLAVTSSGADAITFSFSCTGDGSNSLCTQAGSGGGTVSALLEFEQPDNDTIKVIVDNTSPTEFIPTLLSFGFFVNPDDAELDTFSIVANDDNGAPTDITALWEIVQSESGLSADFVADNGKGIRDGLYNPDVIGEPSEALIGNTNPFFTTATFTFNFVDPVDLVFEEAGLGSGLVGPAFVRFQRTGPGAKGSAKVTCPIGSPGCGGPTPVSEPAMLAMFGTGLMGLAVAYRRRRLRR